MSWDAYQLQDMVEFPCPSGEPHSHVAGGEFTVFAPSRRQADVTARLHLCFMLFEAGLMGVHERSESDDLAE